MIHIVAARVETVLLYHHTFSLLCEILTTKMMQGFTFTIVSSLPCLHFGMPFFSWKTSCNRLRRDSWTTTSLLGTLSAILSMTKILHLHVPVVYLLNISPCKPSLRIKIESITEVFTHAQQCVPGTPCDFQAPENKAELQATSY